LVTGKLIDTLERHYQPISVLKISNDGVYFVTGSEDGLALAWFLPDILGASALRAEQETSDYNGDSRHTWSHSAKVTDIALGDSNMRCATCSLDRTCKVSHLLTKQRI